MESSKKYNERLCSEDLDFNGVPFMTDTSNVAEAVAERKTLNVVAEPAQELSQALGFERYKEDEAVPLR